MVFLPIINNVDSVECIFLNSFHISSDMAVMQCIKNLSSLTPYVFRFITLILLFKYTIFIAGSFYFYLLINPNSQRTRILPVKLGLNL